MRQNWFKPDRMIVVYFAVSKFDKVGKMNSRGNFEQYFRTNLPEAKKDCDIMHEVLDSYGIDDENDVVFDLSNDPTEEEFDEVYDKIK